MDKQRRLQKFSIRKYTVGTCSILIGTLIFLGVPTHDAFASENDANILKHEDSLNDKGKDVVEDNTNNSDSANKDTASDLSSNSVPNNVETSEVEPKNDDHLSESTEQENHAEVEAPSEEHSSEATAKEAHAEENHETLAEQNAKVNHEENNQSDESTAPQDHQDLDNKDDVKQQTGKNVETSDNKRNEHESSQDIEADNDSVESEDNDNAERPNKSPVSDPMKATDTAANRVEFQPNVPESIAVADISVLTDYNRERVLKRILKANAQLSAENVSVAPDGTATIVYDGATAVIEGAKLVHAADAISEGTGFREVVGPNEETGAFKMENGESTTREGGTVDGTVVYHQDIQLDPVTGKRNITWTIEYNLANYPWRTRPFIYFTVPHGVEVQSIEKYYEFGIQNVSSYLDYIQQRETTYPTFLEMLMATYHLVEKAKKTGYSELVKENLDEEKFIKTIHIRADYERTGYFYPEIAMYFKNPAKILNSFFIKHHGYRVRIDDIEHYLSGYVQYQKVFK